MKIQSIKSQKGEIEFRKKLAQQQVEGKIIFNDEFTTEEIERILSDRMKETLEQMTSLKENGIAISPYVEIGAERAQRSLVMENDIGATGTAVDISYDMLKSCEYYGKIFNKNKIPLRVCCDINNLPFMSNSIPFVFCYQTLHHLPDPILVLKEIHRITSPGGHFFFEEPYKKALHVNLYKSGKVYSKKSLNASNIKKVIDYFFARKCYNETDYDITENHEIPLNVWKKALSIFDVKDIKIEALKRINSALFKPRNYLKFILAYLLGGMIFGVCRKNGVNTKSGFPIDDVFICPSCLINKSESKLIQQNSVFICNNCKKKFPIFNGITFLLSYDKFKKLYPEIFMNFQKTGRASNS